MAPCLARLLVKTSGASSVEHWKMTVIFQGRPIPSVANLRDNPECAALIALDG